MYLINLRVESVELDTIIRNITFKKGLNLILDSGMNQTSGNDIGKTTFLRAIDFCLGANLDELYVDRDENTVNTDVKKFLIEREIVFTLQIGTSIEQVQYVLKRGFTGKLDRKGNPEIIQSINGEISIISKYRAALNGIMFQNEDKPSFRDLIPKFIREDKHSVDSMLRYLGSFKSDNEYNSLHLILFGYKGTVSLQEKNRLYYEFKSLENKHSVYTTDYGNINKIEAELSVKGNRQNILSEEIESIQQGISRSGNVRDFLLQINEVTQRINTINTDIVEAEIGIENIQSSIDRMSNAKTNIDLAAIKTLFEEANIFNLRMAEKFEATVHFHDTMLLNKIKFATRSLKKLSHKLAMMSSEKEALLKEYNFENTDNSKFFEILSEKNRALIEINSEIREKETVLEKIQSIEKRKHEISISLSHIIEGIKEAEATIKENINIFNTFFSRYSYNLYGEEQFLSLGDDISEPFVINNKANSGSGKKKAYITAFDLAYTAFINHVGLSYPKFVGEDLVELIDEPQLKVLFDISNSTNGQLIIPVLHSKVSNLHEIVDKAKILTLSDTDRFFKF